MKRIALFPGSFDPFTKAHEDLVRRALPLFDEIHVAIGINSAKQGLLSVDDREASIAGVFAGEDGVKIATFKGLTVDYCKEIGARFILRGLRNGKDLEFEQAIAQNNLILNPDVESYFLLSRSGLSHISSTIVREILRYNGDVTALVPDAVLPFLER
ncbi:pantetheine-phosphate adenylyltransferase [Sphingobacterium corticis]|uniref:Phosphopantetheine adenylyltransferase n=1 Tax=Sphingobacterium corticis TaxID=1812823 RepID=A0ABW5NKB0_9SPHI